MTQAPRIVLASASPRRADLLRQMGLHPAVRPAHVDESYLPGEGAEAHVDRLARMKAESIARSEPGALVVGGDTVVVEGDRILGKPRDEAEAVEMLLTLAGKAHLVLSGIAVTGESGTVSAVGRARVHFRAFGLEEAHEYAATREPLDKAGAYGIQGFGAALVDGIDGDYYTVVGFPIACFIELLARSGWRYAFGSLYPIRP